MLVPLPPPGASLQEPSVPCFPRSKQKPQQNIRQGLASGKTARPALGWLERLLASACSCLPAASGTAQTPLAQRLARRPQAGKQLGEGQLSSARFSWVTLG